MLIIALALTVVALPGAASAEDTGARARLLERRSNSADGDTAPDADFRQSRREAQLLRESGGLRLFSAGADSAPAVAAPATFDDRTDDIVLYDWVYDEFYYDTDWDWLDITQVHVRADASDLILGVDVVGLEEYYWSSVSWSFDVDGDNSQDFDLYVGDSGIALLYETEGWMDVGEERDCSGVELNADYDEGQVWVQIPRSCLGDPSSMAVQAQMRDSWGPDCCRDSATDRSPDAIDERHNPVDVTGAQPEDPQPTPDSTPTPTSSPTTPESAPSATPTPDSTPTLEPTPFVVESGGRVPGGDAVLVAMEVSRRRFDDGAARHVVLSRDDLFPDSLAGAALTAEGPLLFTASNNLSEVTAAELQRVLPRGGQVLLLGGESALAPAIAEAVANLGYEPRRLGGADRFDTAAVIAQEVTGGLAQTVALARADDWADAITGGAWAADQGVPILLAAADDYSPQSRNWIVGAGADELVLLGGTAALDATVAQAAEGDGLTVRRAAGEDRHATAVLIADQLWGGNPDGWVLTSLGDAAGWAYGLAAAGLSADLDDPLLGTWQDRLPTATGHWLAVRCGVVTVIGDTSVISEPAVQAANC